MQNAKKKNLLRNHLARKAETYMEAFSCNVYLKLRKSLPPGEAWGHNGGGCQLSK